MTGSVETFQLSVEAAEVYEARFVPAIFGEWAPHLVEAAGVAPGQAVLDVACGTGVVARTAADRMGGRGRVVGLDLNEGMLAVAGRLRPDIEWRQGDAAELPFEAGSFDAVLCQAALMFFPDRARALREMARVASPGLRVAATRTRVGTVRYASAEEAVATEVEATPLAGRIDPEAYRRMLEAAGEALRPFTVAGGRIELPISGHLITAAKAA